MVDLKCSICPLECGGARVEAGAHAVNLTPTQVDDLKKSGLSLSTFLQWLQTWGPIIANLLLTFLSKGPAKMAHGAPEKFGVSLHDFTDPKGLLVTILLQFKDQLKEQALGLVTEGIDELLAKLAK